jgi:hypothetical protein
VPTTTPSADASVMTLADKTNSVAFGTPDTPPGILALWRICDKMRQDDHAEWGLTLGIAIGIARSENPFESIESVVDRAVPAAEEAFGRYAGRDAFKAAVA